MFLIRLLRACTTALLVSLAAGTPTLGFAQASTPAAQSVVAVSMRSTAGPDSTGWVI